MEFTITQSQLLKSLSIISSIVEKRNTIEILNNIKISAATNYINFCATDMDTVGVNFLDISVNQCGEITVSSQLLMDIARKLTGDLKFKLKNENTLVISSGKIKYSLPTLPVDNFPDVSLNNEYDQSITISTGEFERAIDCVKISMSNEEVRYYLNGIYVKCDENKITLASTDGKRLSESVINIDGVNNCEYGIIIPKKTIHIIRKLIDKCNGDIKLSFNKTSIEFSYNDTTIKSKLIDGNFPDYNRIIPSNNERVVFIDNSNIVDSINRAAVLSDITKTIKFVFSNNNLNVLTTIQNNEFSEDIEIEYSGDEFIIGFNYTYLLDVLKLLDNNVKFLFGEINTMPLLINDENNRFIIMPMRVN